MNITRNNFIKNASHRHAAPGGPPLKLRHCFQQFSAQCTGVQSHRRVSYSGINHKKYIFQQPSILFTFRIMKNTFLIHADLSKTKNYIKNDKYASAGLRFGDERGACAKYMGGLFPMWSTQKSSDPFHAKMFWQRHVSCASVFSILVVSVSKFNV